MYLQGWASWRLARVAQRLDSMFADAKALPPELAEIVVRLRRDEIPNDFRGIPGADLHRWQRRVGDRGKVPSR